MLWINRKLSKGIVSHLVVVHLDFFLNELHECFSEKMLFEQRTKKSKGIELPLWEGGSRQRK